MKLSKQEFSRLLKDFEEAPNYNEVKDRELYFDLKNNWCNEIFDRESYIEIEEFNVNDSNLCLNLRQASCKNSLSQFYIFQKDDYSLGTFIYNYKENYNECCVIKSYDGSKPVKIALEGPTATIDTSSLVVSGISTISANYISNRPTQINSFDNHNSALDKTASTTWTMTMENPITNTENKEKKDMNTNSMFKNFEFGPIVGNDKIKMSPYGMAVKNQNGTYVAYDKVNDCLMDVDILNFNADNMMFKMPVALKDIVPGDVIVHNRIPMIVRDVLANSMEVIDAFAGENKEIVPARSPFGFNFYVKIVSLFDMCGGLGQPSSEQPFGNIWPLMMMANDNKMNPMVMAMMMNSGNFQNMAQNPLMMYALMGDKSDMKDMLPWMFMMQQQTPTVAKSLSDDELQHIKAILHG